MLKKLPLLTILQSLVLTSIRDYWGKLTVLGPKYGYFPKASKSYLIVKEDKLGEAMNVFNDSNVNITIEGKRHLGAVILEQ